MVRFDQPCYRVKGAVEYFREHMALGDYFTEHGQTEMTWFGAGARRLGLAGHCDLSAYENLCRGLHPTTGAKLMVRDKGDLRRVCYFGQVSPPKDVSILYLVGGDERIASVVSLYCCDKQQPDWLAWLPCPVPPRLWS